MFGCGQPLVEGCRCWRRACGPSSLRPTISRKPRSSIGGLAAVAGDSPVYVWSNSPREPSWPTTRGGRRPLASGISRGDPGQHPKPRVPCKLDGEYRRALDEFVAALDRLDLVGLAISRHLRREISRQHHRRSRPQRKGSGCRGVVASWGHRQRTGVGGRQSRVVGARTTIRFLAQSRRVKVALDHDKILTRGSSGRPSAGVVARWIANSLGSWLELGDFEDTDRARTP